MVKTRPIRILQVVSNMNAGGIENMLMNLYRSIDRNKIQFDFLFHTDEHCFFEDEIRELGGTIHRISRLRPSSLFKYLRELDVFFKNSNYKIIHSHRSFLSSIILKYARKYNVPIRIAHSHEAPRGFMDTKKLIIPIAFILKYVTNKHLTHRFACGKDAGVWLFGKYEKFTVINNAIDVEKFTYSKETSSKLRAELNLGDTIVIGHVGNFTEVKNYPFILSVFKEIKRENKNVKLLLVGNNKRNPEIANDVANLNLNEDVIFTGVRRDVFNLYNAMDVFIFPSFSEGLPVTLIEAQASGLKVFASDTITREVALTDDIVFLSLNQSAKCWAKQILEVLPYKRKNNNEIIKKKEYGIVESAKQLEYFYLNEINKIFEINV